LALDRKTLASFQQKLLERAGAWVGRGLDPEGNGFHAWLSLEPSAGGRALTLTVRIADNDDSRILHEGEGLLATGLDQMPVLYYTFQTARATFPRASVRLEASNSGGPRLVFGYGEAGTKDGYRDEIALTLYDDGRLGFSYAWAFDDQAELRRTSVVLASVTTFDDQRPVFIRHWTRFVEDDTAHYPGSDELLSIGAPLGRLLGLKRVGVHVEQLPPGRRTSFPHAESTEEEFIIVMKGFPDVWIDGDLHGCVPGDAIGFPPGTSISHTFINNTADTVQLIVLGETRRSDNLCNYPLNPERKPQMGAAWWEVPERPLGNHDGLPDALRTKKKAEKKP